MEEIENQPEDALPPSLRFDPMDPNIEDIFVNDAYIAVGNSDVSIVFGTQIPGSDKTRPRFRAFMSHATFVSLMAVWMKRADLLVGAYQDNPMAISDIERTDHDRIKRLIEKMISE